MKREVVGLDAFLSNLQGEAQEHFEALLSRLSEAQDLLEEKEDTIFEMEGRERDAADEIAALSHALDEEQSKRVAIMESASGREESLNLAFSSITKEPDHALALVKVLKKEKVDVGVGHDKLLKVLGLGKVVVTKDVTLVNVLLVETLGYNLLSISQLAIMGFGTYSVARLLGCVW